MHLLRRPQWSAAVAGPVHVAAKLAEGRGKGRPVEGYHSCIFRIRRLSRDSRETKNKRWLIQTHAPPLLDGIKMCQPL